MIAVLKDLIFFADDMASDYVQDLATPLLLTFAVKFDGQHRARLCAEGHRKRDTEKLLQQSY